MKKLVLLFSVFLLYTSFVTTVDPRHFTIQKLAPGVWAAINNDNYGHAICNAGIIDLGDKTLIFDPFMNIDAANELKAFARKLTGREATIIVNSHFHNDHIRGNQVFLPATIISTAWTREQIAIEEPLELEWEKKNAARLAAENRKQLKTATGKEKKELPLWIGYYEAMVTNGPLIKTTLPSLTFTDSLHIHGSKRSVVLKEFIDGHTKSDLVMILPAEGIAFMGDLLFEERHPYLPQGRPEALVSIMNKLAEDGDLKRFVPGHGKPGGKDVLINQAKYVTELRKLVSASVDAGVPDSVIRKMNIPVQYSDWKFGRFFPANVNFLLKEARKKM